MLSPSIASDAAPSMREALLRRLTPEDWFSGCFLILWTTIVILPLVGVVIWSLLDNDGVQIVYVVSLKAYQQLFETGRWYVIGRTIWIAAYVTTIELAIAFPVAFWLAKEVRSPTVRVVALAIFTIPFFLSMASRTMVWRGFLGRYGPINLFLQGAGITNEPIDWLLFSEFSIVLGLIGPYFSTMMLPIFISIAMIDDEYIEASQDLGAGLGFTLRTVVIPLSAPGFVAGIIFTFVPLLGETEVSTLLGGGNIAVLSSSIHSALGTLNYAIASALSVIVLAILLVLTGLLRFIMPQTASIGAVFDRLER